jgi:predicted branched-subunit amino acid permease
MTPTLRSFLRGATDAAPFLVVIVPFAMVFGVLATDARLNLFEIMAFSVAVFAGASQFAALKLLQDNAPVLVILATALAVNLRMMMYSVAISPHFGAAPLKIRAIMAYFLVDQSFALSVAQFDKRPTLTLPEKIAYFFGVVAPIVPTWMASTVAGAMMGKAIPPEFALDFAMPITFLAMTAPMIRTAAHGVAAVASVGLLLALGWMPYGTGLLVAGAVGMAVGALVEVWTEKRGGAA